MAGHCQSNGNVMGYRDCPAHYLGPITQSGTHIKDPQATLEPAAPPAGGPRGLVPDPVSRKEKKIKTFSKTSQGKSLCLFVLFRSELRGLICGYSSRRGK